MRSVYIHIPFCSSICSYCDFCKFLHDEIWASEYLDHLRKEILEYYEGDNIKSIYIGGGTPSVMSIKNLEKLMEIVQIFKLEENAEFTFEFNVNDITCEKLELLKKYKVNRISIGVESFDKVNLKYLNRKHDRDLIFNNIALVSKYFDNISVDLIYAIPVESFRVLKNDIKEVLKLNVKHISTYSLIIEKNTVLGIRNTKPISEDKDAKMYDYICNVLSKNGYKHYEVSNFAKEGYESLHNLNYWDNNEYYGFGLGAHGFLNNLRYENTRSFNTYLKDNYRFTEMVVSVREDMENQIILGLRKLDGIDVYEFFKKFKVNIQDEFNIEPLLKLGLVKMNDKNLFIPSDKIYVMNEILNKILN